MWYRLRCAVRFSIRTGLTAQSELAEENVLVKVK
jgi:hypothetical protein